MRHNYPLLFEKGPIDPSFCKHYCWGLNCLKCLWATWGIVWTETGGFWFSAETVDGKRAGRIIEKNEARNLLPEDIEWIGD